MDARAEYERAEELEEVRVEEAIAAYRRVIGAEGAEDVLQKLKEQAIYKLGALYAKNRQAEALRELLTNIRPFFATIPKAKTAKIVRTLIDLVARIEGTTALQVDLCKESIEWARTEKRTFLRHRIEARLAGLYLDTEQYPQALECITRLLREVKKLDDKPLLVEIQLIESRVHHALRNIPKSRAALTAARTAANAIYCPPLMQAQIDRQAGIIHAEDKDYNTAYSYFYEAFEGLDSLDDPRAVHMLKYMLLCKIMTNSPDDVNSIIHGKLALRYVGREVEAMRAVAQAHSKRSLHTFQTALNGYDAELSQDPIIRTHLIELYDTLLQQNLMRLIEPFSRVEISHVAELIGLPIEKVEAKLSQMILDKRLDGILDQGVGCLIIYDEATSDKTYDAALGVTENLNKVVDSLYLKAQKLS